MTILSTTQTAILAVARQQLGKPYQWDGKGPNSFDCSGLTAWAFSHGAGIDIGAGTVGQLLKGTLVAGNVAFGVVQSQLQPCDIIFPSPTHCQLWTGSDVIEAANSSSPVHEVAEWAVPPYQATVFQVRRYLPEGPERPSKPPAWPGRVLSLSDPWMTGSDVKAWQVALLGKGYQLGPWQADGTFGNLTSDATFAFQRAAGFTGVNVDGKVGPNTWGKMFNA